MSMSSSTPVGRRRTTLSTSHGTQSKETNQTLTSSSPTGRLTSKLRNVSFGAEDSDTDNGRKRPTVAFIRRSAQIARHTTLRTHGPKLVPQTFLGMLVFHPRFETFGGIVVLFNFVIITMETHAVATSNDALLEFVTVMNRILLAYYTAECAARLYVMKNRFFLAAWNNLDFLIVVTGMMSEVLEAFNSGGTGMEQITMLKSLRMLRLLRLVRLLVAFRELYMLVVGIGRCMRTLFWASGLIFIVLNVWAILSVEFLQARVKELAEVNGFGTCSWCPNAFANIWYANLTWFQIISTAEWVEIGRPLVEAFYWPYVFFVLNVFVVTWGLLNLIVAGIVDANIAAREDDVPAAAEIAARGFQETWASFAALCIAMDEDGSGDISVDEFKKFWKGNSELQQHLAIMGVQEKDMNDLLLLMDEDGSGLLEQSEFIEQFTTMRTLVVKTSLFFLMKHVQSMKAQLGAQREIVQSIYTDIAEMRRSRNAAAIPTAKNGNEISGQTGNKGAAAFQGAPRRSANEFKSEKPFVDMQLLPPGWYYFGATLPLEASAWCTAIDPNNEVAPSSKFQTDPAKDVTKLLSKQSVSHKEVKEVVFATDCQRWEPVPPSVHARQSTQSTVISSVTAADISDDELGPKAAEPYKLLATPANDTATVRNSDVNMAPQPTGSPTPPEIRWTESRSKDNPSQIPMDFSWSKMFQQTADVEQTISGGRSWIRKPQG